MVNQVLVGHKRMAIMGGSSGTDHGVELSVHAPRGVV
jgi:hypothetical protein